MRGRARSRALARRLVSTRARLLIPLAGTSLLLSSAALHADVLRSAVIGCSKPADAEKIAAVAAQGGQVAATTQAQSLIASRACQPFSKGLKIDVDERRPPLACIRLTGDLSCYWVSAALIDEHPGLGSAQASHHGGGRRH